MEKIQKKRKLTTATIYTHFSKLIMLEAVEIADILPHDKIQKLKKAFNNYENESLGQLKEKHGDAFTWEELRLYMATIK